METQINASLYTMHNQPCIFPKGYTNKLHNPIAPFYRSIASFGGFMM